MSSGIEQLNLDSRLFKLEAGRFEYRVKDLENKFSVLKGYYDDLLKRVVALERMNQDDGK